MKALANEWRRPDGSGHPVFSGVDGIVSRGQKIALTGVNGAGKSTLLKVMAGLTEPSAGTCELGAAVAPGYFSQGPVTNFV
jgi:ATP-binding cassette subfamily F protein 3